MKTLKETRAASLSEMQSERVSRRLAGRFTRSQKMKAKGKVLETPIFSDRNSTFHLRSRIVIRSYCRNKPVNTSKDDSQREKSVAVEMIEAPDATCTEVIGASDAACTEVIEASDAECTEVIKASDPACTEVIEASDPACTELIEASDAACTEVTEASDIAGTAPPDCVYQEVPVTGSGINDIGEEVNLILNEMQEIGLQTETMRAVAECQQEEILQKDGHYEKDLVVLGLGSDSAELEFKVQKDEGQSIRQVADPGNLYKCVTDPMGKKARVCIATPSCVAKPVCIYRRDAMEKHLFHSHGILCFVPGGFRMKDFKDSSGALERESRDKKRSKERFFDAERKYVLARRKFEKGVKVKAQQIYSQLPAQLRPLPQDKFIEAYIEEQMKVYDSRKEEKMKRIKDRIVEGYECHTRVSRARVRDTATFHGIQAEHSEGYRHEAPFPLSVKCSGNSVFNEELHQAKTKLYDHEKLIGEECYILEQLKTYCRFRKISEDERFLKTDAQLRLDAAGMKVSTASEKDFSLMRSMKLHDSD